MATHFSILAWRIPWTEEPGGLQSIGRKSQTGLKLLSTHACTILCTDSWKSLLNGLCSSEVIPTWPLNSIQFSRSVMTDSLQLHELQHARPPCPSPTPGVHSNSCPSSQWCHPAISSSVISFSSCPQSLPASESFPMSQLFPWGGQRTGVSALASFLPKNTQNQSPLQWTG